MPGRFFATPSRRRRSSGATVALSAVCLALAAVQPAWCASRKVGKPPVYLPPPAPSPATPAPPPETKAYDGQLFRLAEILGALSYLRAQCGDKDANEWRDRMQVLLEAEGNPPVRRDRLAGAFNHGFQGYGFEYRTCTLNARVVIGRLLVEGSRLAQDIENRYRSS